jgi:uncharacterized membrane protein
MSKIREKVIDLTFNLVILMLLVAAAVQYFYTEHPNMAICALIGAIVMLVVILVRYNHLLKTLS